jgi:hypothetical protein
VLCLNLLLESRQCGTFPFLQIHRIVTVTHPRGLSGPRETTSSYAVPIICAFHHFEYIEQVQINLDTTVSPRSHLVEWIIEEVTSNRKLIVKDVQSLVPARYIFRVGIRWIASPLSHPYRAMLRV